MPTAGSPLHRNIEADKTMIARDPRASWPYILIRERSLTEKQLMLPPAEVDRLTRELRASQTVFQLKHLSIADEHGIVDNFSRHPVTGIASRNGMGSEHLRVLRRYLVGWKNFRKADGTPIEFEAGPNGGAKDELLYLMPLSVREELAVAIEDEVELTPEELGESSQPSP